MPAPTRLQVLSLLTLSLLLSGCETVSEPSKSAPRVAFIGATKDAPLGEIKGTIDPVRPPHLVPGTIPPRVRYEAADSALVQECAELATHQEAYLKNGIFSDILMVFPGAWDDFRNIPGIDKAVSKPAQFPRNKERIDHGRILLEGSGAACISGHLSKVFDASAPTVRAFSTEEMSLWWPYIPFDISEPIFIVEPPDKSRLYVFSFSKSKNVFIIDELTFYIKNHPRR